MSEVVKININVKKVKIAKLGKYSENNSDWNKMFSLITGIQFIINKLYVTTRRIIHFITALRHLAFNLL